MTESTLARIRKFTSDRDWDQFHSPENLAKSIVIEAAELLENFQWGSDQKVSNNVADELADVLVYCIQLADKMGFNIDEIINNKMDMNEQKYPISLSKSNSKKYTEL